MVITDTPESLSAVNPYRPNDLVGGSEAFIGRRDALQDIIHLLTTPNESAMLIYGQRRMGKTSLLKELALRLPRAGTYRPVSFDLQGKEAYPLNRLLSELAVRLSQELDLPPHEPWGEQAQQTFKEIFLPQVLNELDEDETLVFLFDEFDRLERPTENTPGMALFLYLRDLLSVDPYHLKFIFTLGRDPGDFINLSQTIFKGARQYHIDLFDFSETETLVRLSEQTETPTLNWGSEAVDTVYRLTRGHPALTQQLCWQVWERAHQQANDPPAAIQPLDVEAAVSDALRDGDNALAWVFEALPPAEQLTLAAMAQISDPIITRPQIEAVLKKSGVRVIISELQNAPLTLQKWDVVDAVGRDNAAGYRFRVPLFRQWLARNRQPETLSNHIDQLQPMADSLYHQAQIHYEASEFDLATPKLRKATGLNPNHLKANMLLAEILLAQSEYVQARQVLESLYEYQPGLARPRLIQALLLEAGNTQREDRQLELYNRILVLDTDHPEAAAARVRIWERRGDAAAAAGNLEGALEAYQQAGRPPTTNGVPIPVPESLHEKQHQVEIDLKQQQFSQRLTQFQTLEDKEAYQEALELARQLHLDFPNHRDQLPDLKTLEQRARLSTLYQQGLLAIQDGDRVKAQDLFSQIVAIDSSYREATRFLHLLATGVDLNFVRYQLEQEQWHRAQAEANAWFSQQQVQRMRRKEGQTRERNVLLALFGSLAALALILACVLLSLPLTLAAVGLGQTNTTPTVTVTNVPLAFPMQGPPTFTPVLPGTPASAMPRIAGGPLSTFTPTPTETPSPSPTPTVTETPTATLTEAPTSTPSATPTRELITENNSPLPTPTNSPSPTPTPDESATATNTPTPETVTVGNRAGIFGNSLSVNSFEVGLSHNPLRPGDRVNVTVEWELINNIDVDLNVAVQLLTMIDGRMLPSHGSQINGDSPLLDGNNRTSDWNTGREVTGRYTVTLNQGAPGGNYQLALVIYDPEEPTQQRQPVQPGEKTGALGNEILILQDITVAP